jgi:hypothetical protein
MSLRGKFCRLAVLMSVALVLPRSSAGQVEPDSRYVLVRTPAALDITKVLRGALRKLQDSTSQQLMDDFTDREGRSLREKLGPSTQAAEAAKASGPGSPSVLLHHPAGVPLVRRALESARHKLGLPECQRLLDDFHGADGHSLRQNLEALGLGPSEYLAGMMYRDGGDLESGRCQSAGASAVTHPGDRTIYVCADNFRAQTPGIRANTVLHEMLHSLGLGENPPSSAEINRQVRRRCGT